MKQYVQTDLEADRQAANTLAELIIGGALASLEIGNDRRRGLSRRPCTNLMQKAFLCSRKSLWPW
jgi:hypothetical protein